MRWDQEHESPDVVDRRGEGGGGGGGGGGLLYLIFFLLRRPHGWIIVLLIGGFFLAKSLLFSGARQAANVEAPAGGPAETREVHFVSFVLDDAQATWAKELAARGVPYRHAKLVLFTNATPTGCGYGKAATGPFYCPIDERVYIDLGFYDDLARRLGARGDFAEAYVVAHEVGHHVQKLLGESRARTTVGAEGTSVRTELQADCYAGLWAARANQRGILEKGDIAEAVNAAGSVGDDRIQRAEAGTVHPDTFTHGTSAERVRWFTRGYQQGSIEACDTFSAPSL
jgi:uncharacterized protein